MRVTVDVFREADGRLEGLVTAPGGAGGPFVSTLDLLRVLEGLRLTPSPRPAASPPETETDKGPDSGPDTVALRAGEDEHG